MCNVNFGRIIWQECDAAIKDLFEVEPYNARERELFTFSWSTVINNMVGLENTFKQPWYKDVGM